MRGKRGLSGIITTLILILLVIAAIAIIWGVVKTFVTDSADEITLDKFTLNLEIKNAYLNDDDQIVISVSRGAGEGTLTGLKFVVQDDEYNSEVVEVETELGGLETSTFTLNMSWENLWATDASIISVAPIYKTSGEDELGEIMDTFDLSEGFANAGDEEETTCTPDCTGKYCGDDDGCGGECTACINGGTCSEGSCGVECTPSNCTSLGYGCGTGFNDGCGGTLDCSVPGCSEGYECVAESGLCVEEACVQENASTICAEVECGTVTNEASCGLAFDCTAAGINCSTGYECSENLCVEKISFNSGTIANAWPPGAGIFFDSLSLPTEGDLPQLGYWVAFPGVEETCWPVSNYIVDTDVYSSAIVELTVTGAPLSISSGDSYSIWELQSDCVYSLP